MNQKRESAPISNIDQQLDDLETRIAEGKRLLRNWRNVQKYLRQKKLQQKNHE